MDINRAVATWQKLLDTNLNCEGKDKVLDLMAQTKAPGVQAKNSRKTVASVTLETLRISRADPSASGQDGSGPPNPVTVTAVGLTVAVRMIR